MVGVTFVMAIWGAGLGAALLFYGLLKCCQTACQMVRVWGLRRRLNPNRHRFLLSTKRPQVGRRLPQSNGTEPPVPAWLERATRE